MDKMKTIDVLIIDDDPMFPMLLEYVWSKECSNTQYKVFKDAGDALEDIVARSAHPDIILLDLYTLGMDGRDFLKKYEEFYPGGPRSIIYSVTASVSPEDMEILSEYNYLAGSLEKPVEYDDVLRIITSHKIFI